MTISIRARKGSFWRAGIRHTETPVAYEEDAFTDEQLAALRAESKLIVEDDTGEAVPTPSTPSKPKAKK